MTASPTRRQLVFLLGSLLLVLVEFVVLALRFVGDFRTGGVIDITPDLIIPYAEECTNDDRGARVENFTGLFATTRWIDLPRDIRAMKPPTNGAHEVFQSQ